MSTVITLTGDRPEAFRLCHQYLMRQTVKPDHWIIVDDGRKPLHVEKSFDDDIVYCRREPTRNDPVHTLKPNFLVALKEFERLGKSFPIIFMEDDDWYHPFYIENMLEGLEHTDLFGGACTIYYNVLHREWRNCFNRQWASLCETGFNEPVYRWFLKECKETLEFKAMDMCVWKQYSGEKMLYDVYQRYCVGIKGMPGRLGQTSGHRRMPNKDPSLYKLSEFIGEDALLYK